MLQGCQIEASLLVERLQIVAQNPLRLPGSDGAERLNRRLDDLGSIRFQPLRRHAHGCIAIPGEERGGGSPGRTAGVLETAAQVGEFRTAGSPLPVIIEDIEDSSGPAGAPASAICATDVEANSAASVRDQEPGCCGPRR
jgi:hypothetical protein